MTIFLVRLVIWIHHQVDRDPDPALDPDREPIFIYLFKYMNTLTLSVRLRFEYSIMFIRIELSTFCSDRVSDPVLTIKGIRIQRPK